MGQKGSLGDMYTSTLKCLINGGRMLRLYSDPPPKLIRTPHPYLLIFKE